jgi:exonuclease III
MKGRMSTLLNPNDPIAKWSCIAKTIREKKIGILCRQETHLEDRHISSINELYGQRLKVYNSAHPENPGAATGVAIVINLEILPSSDIVTKVLSPGRALLMKIRWRNDHTLKVLNTYAPNVPLAHPIFWSEVKNNLLHDNELDIDLHLGNFNMVEDPLDRVPSHSDDNNTTNELQIFKELFQLQDTWRQENPMTRSFTFTNSTHSMSRIDHIYTKPALANALHDWEITTSAVPSDHKMVLVCLASSQTPYISKGRWTWPLTLISNEPLMKMIQERGSTLQKELENADKATHQPQTLWLQFKNQITDLAKTAAKKHIPKMTRKIKSIRDDIYHLEHSPDLDSNTNKRAEIALLTNEIDHLENKKYKNMRAKMQAKWHDKGEQINKYWSKIHPPKCPRDILYAIQDPTSNHLATHSSTMAKIARDHHNNLQSQGLLDRHHPDRIAAECFVLQQIPESQYLNDPNSDLNNLISIDQT